MHLPLPGSFLHARLRTATLRHDADGQATLLNLLLRNYLHYNLYDQAEKLVSKSVFPEQANNNEWARYLYYTGEARRGPRGAGRTGCPRPRGRREQLGRGLPGRARSHVCVDAAAGSSPCRAHQGHPAGVLGGAAHHDECPAEGAAAHGRRLQADGEQGWGAHGLRGLLAGPGKLMGVGPPWRLTGFSLLKVHKLLIVVELLLGEIPDRLQFRQPSLKRSLMPYFLLTQGTAARGPWQQPPVLRESRQTRGGGGVGAAGVSLPSPRRGSAADLLGKEEEEGGARPGSQPCLAVPTTPGPRSLPHGHISPPSRQDREPGQVQPSPRSVWGQVPG